MAFKSPLALGDSFLRNSKNQFFYDPKYESIFTGVDFGDKDYDALRDKFFNELTTIHGLKPDQANDILDTWITKATHYEPNKLNHTALRRKVGKFETGNNWDDSQKQAKQLLRDNPELQSVLYGLRFENETPKGNTGLKKPIPLYGDDLQNISRAFSYRSNPKFPPHSQKFQFDTFYRNQLDEEE